MPNFDDDGYCRCPECKGQKVIPMRLKMPLLEVCPNCKGGGSFDWVEYTMGRIKKESTQTEYYVVQRNIHTLIQMIKEEGMKVGKHISVEIRSEPMSYGFSPFTKKYMEDKY